MTSGIAKAQVPARNGAALRWRNAEHARSLAMTETKNDFEGAFSSGAGSCRLLPAVCRIQGAMALHHANSAPCNGNLVAAADAPVDEQRIVLVRAPALGE